MRESAYLRVRKLLYHIDRAESQDGNRVCSGWAFAKTWDGRCLPVNIRVAAPGGEQFAAEITRRARADVAEMFKLRRVENPEFGFDCVWQAAPGSAFAYTFPWATGKASMRDKREGLLCTNQKKRFRQSCCFWRI